MHLSGLVVACSLLTLTAAAQTPTPPARAASQAAVAPVTGAVPLPVAAPHVGTYDYKATLKNKFGVSNVQMTVSVQQVPDAWKIVDTVVTDAGKTTITTLLDRRTLMVLGSSLHRGQMDVEMKFKDGKVDGEIATPAGVHAIHGETGPLLAGSAGDGIVLACLPLTKGYRVSYPSFDSFNQKPGRMHLQVLGSEKITVPAGTFDTYRIEVSSLETSQKTTLWVDKATRMPVKAVRFVPISGGVNLTSELTSSSF